MVCYCSSIIIIIVVIIIIWCWEGVQGLMYVRQMLYPLDYTVSPFQYLKKNFCLYRYLN